jgi:arginyl-tRNA synthetase
MNVVEQIEQVLRAQVQELFPEQAPQVEKSLSVALNDDPNKQQFGDISTNAAMLLAKLLGENPRVVAGAIIASLAHPLIDSCAIAGPGFINITLTSEAFRQTVHQFSEDFAGFFKLRVDAPRHHYSIEYVSANPTGPLHLGHGRGGIIGDVLGNIERLLGHTVTKEFYINDAGKQIESLGLSLKIRCEHQLGIPAELPEEGYRGEYLITLAQELCANQKPAVDQALAAGDTRFFGNYAKQKLLAEQQETLRDYGIDFDTWFSESTLHKSGEIDTALEQLRVNGVTFEQDGALWFASTRFGDDKDRVLRKSDGTLTYVAPDIAYLRNKIMRGADKLVIVLGQDHHSYVVRLKGLMQALGYNPDDLDVILYQLVTLKEDGAVLRMSKRAGRMVTLRDVIDAVGADVARFFYLNRKADAHLEFDIALALRKTEENPVYYIQYAYVRTNSILEKAGAFPQLLPQMGAVYTFDEHEKLLIKKILALKVLLQNIGHNYQVHLLAYYVIELANNFHSFYAGHKVIDPENPEQSRRRLVLITLLKQTFELCFKLLGISCPEKM